MALCWLQCERMCGDGVPSSDDDHHDDDDDDERDDLNHSGCAFSGEREESS